MAKPCVVVTPRGANRGEQRAAAELVEHLSQALKADIAVRQEGEAVSGCVLFVGRTLAAKAAGVDTAAMADEEWRLKAAGPDRLIVAGGGQTGRGTLYAAYEALERLAGVVWPCDRYTHIPALGELTWPADLDVSGNPVFMARGVYAYHKKPAEPRRVYMARNRMNFFHDEGYTEDMKALGLDPVYGSPRACHTYFNYTSDLEEADYDCFSMDASGKRQITKSASGPGNICFTNPKTRRHFIRRLREYIAADRANPQFEGTPGPWIYEISANDNSAYCHCPDCLAAAEKYGAYSGVVIEFTNALAKAIEKDYPEVRLQMFAYTFSEEPPDEGAIAAHPQVLIRLAQIGTEFSKTRQASRSLLHPYNAKSLEHLQRWSRYGTLSIWDYSAIWGRSKSITDFTYIIPVNYQLYADNNIRCYFAEFSSGRSIFYQLRLWLGMRFSYHPGADIDVELPRFLRAYYGPAADTVKQIIDYINRKTSTFPGDLAIDNQLRTDLDQEFFRTVNALFDQAETQVGDNRFYFENLLEERGFVDMIHLDRAAQTGLDAAQTEALRQRFLKNYPYHLRTYVDDDKVQAKVAELEEKYAAMASKKNLPVPEQFKGMEIVADLAWPDFVPTHGGRAKIIADPDAALGRTEKFSRDTVGAPFEYGFYDVTSKKTTKQEIAADKIIQDEKYHWYELGPVTVTPSCYVYADKSWWIQHGVSHLYQEGGNNTYRVFFSFKLLGPGFVAGSKADQAICLDRILVVR
ncbi:MAG: DUF4838 domain-containing protein [Lentisphaeria bacterium]|nr:DUF4838 domain-containing protein [Lentisphaeria bacterium]